MKNKLVADNQLIETLLDKAIKRYPHNFGHFCDYFGIMVIDHYFKKREDGIRALFFDKEDVQPYEFYLMEAVKYWVKHYNQNNQQKLEYNKDLYNKLTKQWYMTDPRNITKFDKINQILHYDNYIPTEPIFQFKTNDFVYDKNMKKYGIIVKLKSPVTSLVKTSTSQYSAYNLSLEFGYDRIAKIQYILNQIADCQTIEKVKQLIKIIK